MEGVIEKIAEAHPALFLEQKVQTQSYSLKRGEWLSARLDRLEHVLTGTSVPVMSVDGPEDGGLDSGSSPASTVARTAPRPLSLASKAW